MYIRRFLLSKPGVARSDSSQVQKRVPTSRVCYNNETGPKPAEILNSRHKAQTHTNFQAYSSHTLTQTSPIYIYAFIILLIFPHPQ